MPKISEEDSFMASIEAINNNATKLANKKSLSEKNDEFFLKSDKKNNEAEKNNFIEYFSKKIEENIKDFFMISKLKPKPKPLNTSQKKNNISKVFSSNKNKSVKKITTLIKEEEKCLPQISFKLNFDEIKNNSSDKTDSLNVELDEIKNLSFDKISGFFSNEKEKLFGFSLKNDRNFDSAISDIEKVRNMEILNSESPKRNVHYTLNFESSFNDNAFLMDSNEENLSKDDLVNLLYLIEEKGVEKVLILFKLIRPNYIYQ